MNAVDRKQLYNYLGRVKDKGIKKVYIHWTAGRYTQVFADYHICIKGDGEVWFTTVDLSELKAHTYRRNTGAIGIALCCAYNATPPHNFGEYPPTTAQIEAVSEAVAIICKELAIPITVKHVMTHAEAAENADGVFAHEAYGPEHGCERWDLWYLMDYDGQWKNGGDVLRGKARWYGEKYLNN